MKNKKLLKLKEALFPDHTKMSDDELAKRMVSSVLATTGIMAICFVGLLFFAPKIGFVFGLLSKYRNVKDKAPIIKPNAPVFSNLPTATKDEKLTLTGYAIPGSTVIVMLNGPEKARTISGADGIFTVTDLKLNTGPNSLSGKTIGADGTESDPSPNYKITLDTRKPELTITTPKDKSTVRNLDKRIQIEGKVDEKATVQINEHYVIVRDDLTFDFLLGANEGNNEIKIKVTDEAGNLVEQKLNVTYEKKSI